MPENLTPQQREQNRQLSLLRLQYLPKLAFGGALDDINGSYSGGREFSSGVLQEEFQRVGQDEGLSKRVMSDLIDPQEAAQGLGQAETYSLSRARLAQRARAIYRSAIMDVKVADLAQSLGVDIAGGQHANVYVDDLPDELKVVAVKAYEGAVFDGMYAERLNARRDQRKQAFKTVFGPQPPQAAAG